MAEYIEIEQLWKCKTCYHKDQYGCTLGLGCDHGESYRPDYDKLKKADVAPVRHGRWGVTQVNGVDAIFACSECSREVKAANDYFGKPTEHIAKIYPYCHCGAKMDSKGGNDAN